MRLVVVSLRLRASRPTAWMCPSSCGQIQTWVHAGGMTRERMRASVAPSTAADYVGLMYMARAGYDPEQAVKVLEALEADSHLHVHKENNVLFPAVLSLAQP